MERFLREKRTETTDRAVHELQAWRDAMWCAGTYDQLKAGLACCGRDDLETDRYGR